MYKTDRFKRHKEYLKYSMPYAKIIHEPAIVLNKDGSMQATFKYRGPDLNSAIKEQLGIITQQLNASFQGLETGWVLYFEAQRVASKNYATDVFFPDIITRAMDEERKKFFSDGRHYESNYYATIYWLPPNDNEGRLRELVVEGAKHKEISVEDNVETFAAVVDKLVGVFASLRIPAHFLSQDEMLTYLHSCVSDNARQIKMPEKNILLDNYLYDSAFYGGLEPRLGKKHVRVITPTGYLNNTVFGMFDRLNQLDFSYRWVTRFYCLSKQDSIEELNKIKKGWYGKMKPLTAMVKELLLDRESSDNLNENAVMKFDESRDAITAVEADVTSYGFYSSMIVVSDENEEAANQKAQLVEQTLINLGFRAKVEDLNAIDAWMGSLPGNVGHFVRRPMISCANLVHMIPISDIWAGETRNKHLKGAPLIYTQTAGNTPFRLSLHVGDVGHTLIVGPTGAGKSVQLNIIAASFRKYKDARVFIFDKGASSMVLTAGVGGKFYDLGNENQHLSFQPLAEIDDEKEKQWAQEWLCDFIRQENVTVTPEYKKLIWDALSTVASYSDKSFRRMTNLVNAIQSVELKTALQSLTISGAYGEIFDADADSLQLSSWQTFEMERLMSTPAIVGSTLMYIFHRIEQSLNGSPTLIILDECWVFFDNEQFAQKIREWLKVLRKANASVVFATQSLTDIVESPIFSTVLESCPSQIFLPNDKALEESLKEKYFMFGLNQRQVEIIANAVRKKQYYYSSPLGCRLYDLALENCPLSLAYVAVNKTDNQQAKKILKEYGQENFNRHWLEYRKVNLPEVETERRRFL